MVRASSRMRWKARAESWSCCADSAVANAQGLLPAGPLLFPILAAHARARERVQTEWGFFVNR